MGRTGKFELPLLAFAARVHWDIPRSRIAATSAKYCNELSPKAPNKRCRREAAALTIQLTSAR